MQLFGAIELQAADAHLAQLHSHWQLQMRQAPWRAAFLIFVWRQAQLDALALQPLDTQGQAQQTQR
ncbi:hypothetical protein D3C71_1834230 [compost metagenome]